MADKRRGRWPHSSAVTNAKDVAREEGEPVDLDAGAAA